MNSLEQRRRYLLAASNSAIWLYKEGEPFAKRTGGWSNTLKVKSNSGSLYLKDTYMQLAAASTANISNPRRTAVVTQTQINTAGRSKLYLEFSFDFIESASTIYIALYSSSTSTDASYIVAASGEGSSANERKTITLDLSAYQGRYNIGVMYFRDDGSSNNFYVSAFVHNVWME